MPDSIKIIYSLITLFILGCSPKESQIEINSEEYHNVIDRITDVMVEDIFSPPLASRVYAYSNIAAHEILALQYKEVESFSRNYKMLSPLPKVGDIDSVNYNLAALIANLEVAKHLVFSEYLIQEYQDSLYTKWKEQNSLVFENSKLYGNKVAYHILEWIKKDGYIETRNMSKFFVESGEISKWQPTPPSYMDGIEPHWSKLRPFTLDSASQFIPNKHPDFSLETNSLFYKELREVYDIGLRIKDLGDTSEEIQIAKFWDCNPYVSNQRGHLMYATKKITPGGHWIGICKIASRDKNLNFQQSVLAYTATSIAIADAFISCWDEKYRSQLIRPETLINRLIDATWNPILQTPPFPEYPSGHSVVSGSAATVLTKLFGENFEYNDDTEVKYGLPIRQFSSFNHASEEAALSRLYGGIHYRSAIEEGLVQGRNVGKNVVNRLNLTKFAW